MCGSLAASAPAGLVYERGECVVRINYDNVVVYKMLNVLTPGRLTREPRDMGARPCARPLRTMSVSTVRVDSPGEHENEASVNGVRGDWSSRSCARLFLRVRVGEL